jgi:hypothetical protein
VSRLRPADLVAGAGGLVLLVSLFLPWYGVSIQTPRRPGSGPIAAYVIGRPHATAWQAFSVTDVLLALAALLAIGLVVVTATSTGPAKPVAFTVMSGVASLLAVLLIAYRLLNQPGPNDLVEVRGGAWLGFAAALVMFVGSWAAMRDERTPGAAPPEIPRRPAP